jgi:hypothetical protein
MGVVVAEGDQPESQGAAGVERRRTDSPLPRTIRLEGLVMLDSSASEPVAIEAMFFAENGIGVIRQRGERPRILPWSALSAHAVETWVGGEVPVQWLLRDPEGEGREPWLAPNSTPAPRPMPRVGSGALIGIQTSFGTYRFVYPGGDPSEIARRVTAFAVRHQGPGAASTETRVVSWGRDVERRQSERRPAKPAGWARLQPFVVAGMVVLLAAVVTLILLQSAGAIHLPLLGGSGGSGGGTVKPIWSLPSTGTPGLLGPG